MFTLFVLKKDKSGMEYCARKGRATSSKEKALIALNKCKKGVVLDTGEITGISQLETYLRYGCKPIASVGMDQLHGVMMLKAIQ